MTIETWMQEFYPVHAFEAAQGSAKDATVHSIRKWEGLRKAALAKHGCLLIDNRLYDADDSLSISSETCALCVKFYRYTPTKDEGCLRCPLAKTRDGKACDKRMQDEEIAPYYALEYKHDPEPMIAWLGKALSECP